MKAKRAALILNNAGHGLGNRSDTAHRIMDTEFLFEMADQDIHRGHVKRIPPDKERMEAKRHPQSFILKPLCRMRINRAIRAQHAEFWQNLDQVPQLVHGTAAEIFEPKPIARGAVLQEPLIALGILRRKARHFGAHRIGVLAGGKM